MNAIKQILLATLILLATIAVATALPDGALIEEQGPGETKTNSTPSLYAAEGGNITEINLTGEVATQVWQGFFGEVTGNITLEDSDGDVMFSFNVTNLSGEVYATRFTNIDFTSIGQLNDSSCLVDEELTGSGNDRVNATFFNNTVDFDIGTIEINNTCQQFTFVNSAAQTASFEEIIVNETTGGAGVTRTIYVTRIDANTTGFDGASHDYQMIVPENSTSALTTYFFFVEFS